MKQQQMKLYDMNYIIMHQKIQQILIIDII